MPDKQPARPESSAVRVALWRALHLQVDPPATLAERYFAGRTDGLHPPNNSEEFLVATA